MTTTTELERLKHLIPDAKMMELNLDDIYIDPAANTRQIGGEAYSPESIKELADQIEAVGGLLYPLTVFPIAPSPDYDNKPYILHVGFRRALSLKKLVEDGHAQYAKVKALVLDGDHGQAGLTAVQLLENMSRRDLTPMEKSNGIEQIIADSEGGMTQTEVGKFFGLSGSEVSNLRKLQNLPREIQDEIHAGTIQFSFAREIARDIEPKDYATWAAKAKSGMTIGKFMDELEAYKAAKNPQPADGDAAGVASKGESSPRATKTLSASQLTDTYIPFVEERLKTADATQKIYTAADLEKARLDALKTAAMEATTVLNEQITPFMQKQAEEKAALDKKKADSEEESKFLRDLVKQTKEVYKQNSQPDPLAPDKTYKLSEAMAVVIGKVMTLPEEKVKELGFPLEKDAGKLSVKLSEAYAEMIREQKEKDAKAKERKAKKEAEEKAAAEKAAAEGKAPAAAATAK